MKGNSDYFRGKYGTPNPPFIIRGEDTEIWPGGWKEWDIAVCIIYGWRNGVELLPTEGKVYYGHIFCSPITPDSSPVGLVELVHESELEPHEGPLTLPSSNITFEKSDPGLIRGSAPPKETKVNED
ncbi:unnamed protein product [marine sediment metagenome]|uniref:Uncharacterized protein n=1 Tax=marine sediment metagenome TaxID=412755 RepID=X1VXG8_9ZZZZ